ncbi:MRP-L47-domain-containing protein [Xylariaceae sp. FL0804]|nr:MRP-L47-domain-containing protein [Xylariaceae sp. FL0804]
MAMPTLIQPSIGRALNASRQLPSLAVGSILAASSPGGAARRCPFSTTPDRGMRRPRRDANPNRGRSSIYRSGPRFRMNIDVKDLPQPTDFKKEVAVDPDHGLYGFFYKKDKPLPTPEEDAQHGRAWTVEELRHKSWEDLHRLHWVCVKEQNRIATARAESKRLELLTGSDEMLQRNYEVRKTMKAIRHTLTERFYAWEDARTLAETDPEVDLSGEGTAYTPLGYEDDSDPFITDPEVAKAETEAVEREIAQKEASDRGLPESPAEPAADSTQIPKSASSTTEPRAEETPHPTSKS